MEGKSIEIIDLVRKNYVFDFLFWGVLGIFMYGYFIGNLKLDREFRREVGINCVVAVVFVI